MVDIRKLIVVFLALAALASSSALVLSSRSSSFASSPRPNPPFATQTIALTNAFLQATSSIGAQENSANAAAAASSTNSLTDRLTDSILNNLLAANPNGPQDDGNGNQFVTAPRPQDVISDISSSSLLGEIQIPDWDFEAAENRPRVTTDISPTAVASYSDALNNLINRYFIKTNLQNIVGNTKNAAPSDVSYVASQINSALWDMNGLTVPENLVAFHESFVKVLVYEKNALALAEDTSNDPAENSVILQAESDKYNAAVQEFQNAWQNAMQNKSFSFAMPGSHADDKGGLSGFLTTMFGIPKANAQWITFDPSVFMQMVWEFLQSVLLQILKNTVITQLQNKVLKLIQNGGNPMFVQGWQSLLSGAFDVAAGSALGQIEPGLCGYFSTDVTNWLQGAYPTVQAKPNGFSLNGSPGTNCTVQNTVNDIPGYYNDFNTGGFAGLAAFLTPANNPFGAFAEANDAAQAVASQAKNAAQNKSLASQGFKGQEICDDGLPPDPKDAGLCPDGSEPIVTTPGKTFGDTLGRNLNSDIDLIVNANDITGLLATIVGSLLQQVILAGANGLIGAKPAGTGSPATTPPTPPKLNCSPSQSFGAMFSQLPFGATGGPSSNYTWLAAGGIPATGSGALFTTSFYTAGIYNVVVTSGAGSASTASAICTVTVQ